MPCPSAHDRRAAALFVVLDFLFSKGFGISRKYCQWRCDEGADFEALRLTLAAALELMTEASDPSYSD